MNVSIWLLTAACAAGPMETTVVMPQATHPYPAMTYARPPRPTFFQAVRDKFGGTTPAPQAYYPNQSYPVQSYPVQSYPVQMGQPQMTTGQPLPAEGIVVVSSEEVVGAAPQQPPVEYQLSKGNEFKVGHSQDWKWVTGQLFYVHVDGGRWVLRYASLGETDEYGGSIVLAPTVSMKNFREGDLVSVSGHLLGGARASRQLGGPLYRVETIDMVERAD